jgi:hypothetical protein
VAWFGSMTVHVSCFTPGAGSEPLTDAHASLTKKSIANSRRSFEFAVHGGQATAMFNRERDATDDCLAACAFVTLPDMIGLATVAFDSESQEEEVERILRSFRVVARD